MATKKRSLVSGLRPEVHRLPLNRPLGAHNVYEIPVDASLIEAARAIYRQHIAPRVSDQHGSFHSGDFAFHVNRPPDWGSDISWWSADDAQTYRYFESEFFLKVNLGEPLDRLIDIDSTVRLYCPLFVVRSRCERTFFHVDYEPGCGTNAYTLMTPLEDMSSMGDGHLAYLDARGRPCIYRYKKGTAIVFGTSFFHGTQVVAGGQPQAFLCFTFGSDKEKYWPEVKKSIYGQSRLLCTPSGTLLTRSTPECEARHPDTAPNNTVNVRS